MDFEYKKDIYGQPVARFSMEHEVIGRWLTEEIGNNRPKIQQILTLIQQFELGSIGFKEITGLEFQLSISHIGVEIKALNLDMEFIDNFNSDDYGDNDDEQAEDGELYDKESYAECGLVDLKLALLSWQDYIG